MDKILPVIKAVLKLTWIAIKISCYVLNIMLNVSNNSSSKSRVRPFGHAEAHGLFHDGKITIADFVESTRD